MKVNRNNRPPVRPEKSDKREKRRQKACAFRTFNTPAILSPPNSRASGEVQAQGTHYLSIQIDTFRDVALTASSITITNYDSQIICTDRTKMTRYKFGSQGYRCAQHLAVNAMRRDNESVKEGRNA